MLGLFRPITPPSLPPKWLLFRNINFSYVLLEYLFQRKVYDLQFFQFFKNIIWTNAEDKKIVWSGEFIRYFDCHRHNKLQNRRSCRQLLNLMGSMFLSWWCRNMNCVFCYDEHKYFHLHFFLLLLFFSFFKNLGPVQVKSCC